MKVCVLILIYNVYCQHRFRGQSNPDGSHPGKYWRTLAMKIGLAIVFEVLCVHVCVSYHFTWNKHLHYACNPFVSHPPFSGGGHTCWYLCPIYLYGVWPISVFIRTIFFFLQDTF